MSPMVAGNSGRRPSRPRDGGSPVPFDVLADPPAVADHYRAHLERTGLAPETIRSYTGKTASFCSWLAAQSQHDPGETFTDPHSRDFAARDYRAHLLHERHLAPASVDAHLSAADSLFTWVGLGRSTVRRVHDTSGEDFGEHLTTAQARDVMRAAERRGPRDLALVGVMLLAGTRLAETVGVDVDDYWLSDRRGQLQVRGKGERVRTIQIGAQLREVLRGWESDRRGRPGADGPALFLAGSGARLSARTAHHVVAQVGLRAGVPGLHPHQLRHTCARQMLEAGVPAPDVQRILGHASLSTTQLYTKPTRESLAEAADAWRVEW